MPWWYFPNDVSPNKKSPLKDVSLGRRIPRSTRPLDVVSLIDVSRHWTTWRYYLSWLWVSVIIARLHRAVLPHLPQHKVSLSVWTKGSGHIVQGCVVHTDDLFKGYIILGTHCPRILKLKKNINKLRELINRHKEGLLPPANYYPSVAIKKKIIT